MALVTADALSITADAILTADGLWFLNLSADATAAATAAGILTAFANAQYDAGVRVYYTGENTATVYRSTS